MQSPNEKPQICWSCEKNEATEPFMYAGHNTLVCVTCLSRRKARDELEDVLQQSTELAERGLVDAALASLDAILDAIRDYDHDRRFARRVADYRVMILLD